MARAALPSPRPASPTSASRTSSESPDWLDRVAAAAGMLGFNRVRVRWKLENWRRRRGQARRRREQRAEHIRYAHKTCDHCGAVQDRDASVCSRCGERLGRRGFQVLRRFGVLAPQWMSMSSLLGFALVLAFARVVLASQGGFSDLFGFDNGVLFVHGASFAPAVEAGAYWRLLTASFLHGGLLHLGFNLFALAVVGPQVEALYGRLQMLFLFVATGVVAFVGSAWLGPGGVAIGASGGIMGLVGVAAGWGHRDGTGHGRAVRNDMLKWSAYVFVIGLLLSGLGIDNWAHLFGLLGGLAFGYSVRPRVWKLSALLSVRAATGAAGIVATVIALVMIARPAVTLAELDAPASVRIGQRLQAQAEICRLYWSGDQAGAVARARETREVTGVDVQRAEEVGGLCEGLIEVHDECRRGGPPPPELPARGGDAVRLWADYCYASEQVFGPGPAKN